MEGQNVLVEYRWAEGDRRRLPALAAELVARPVDVLVGAAGATLVAKQATTTIPIVGLAGADPVKAGLVDSLNRRGGNITGVVMFGNSLGPKRLELIRDAVPSAQSVAILANPNSAVIGAQTEKQEIEAAARAVGQQTQIVEAGSDADLEPAFVSTSREGAGALLVMGDVYFSSRRKELVALAAKYAIPAIYEWREFVSLGGLMSYGTSFADAFRLLGVYTAQILHGAKPSELPFQQAVKLDLALNLKTAKALGLTFPLSLVGRADEVIE
jgi:putative ABC transport system substrate-binding protein